MSTPDQVRMAKMFATGKRHTARHQVDDLDEAVADLREEADGRVDLLSELAGLHIGFEQADLDTLASRHQAIADLAFRGRGGPASREMDPGVHGQDGVGPPDASRRRNAA